MVDPVQHMASRLAGQICHCRACKGIKAKTAGFKDTLVTNISDMADMVSKLNLNGDPTLDAFAVEMATLAKTANPDDIRSSDDARSRARAEAEVMMQRMSQYRL